MPLRCRIPPRYAPTIESSPQEDPLTFLAERLEIWNTNGAHVPSSAQEQLSESDMRAYLQKIYARAIFVCMGERAMRALPAEVRYSTDSSGVLSGYLLCRIRHHSGNISLRRSDRITRKLRRRYPRALDVVDLSCWWF